MRVRVRQRGRAEGGKMRIQADGLSAGHRCLMHLQWCCLKPLSGHELVISWGPPVRVVSLLSLQYISWWRSDDRDLSLPPPAEALGATLPPTDVLPPDSQPEAAFLCLLRQFFNGFQTPCCCASQFFFLSLHQINPNSF